MINSASACPFRQLTLDLTSKDRKMIEIDSLTNILNLVKDDLLEVRFNSNYGESKLCVFDSNTGCCNVGIEAINE